MLGILSGTIYRWFHPLLDALFAPGISFNLRWRLLAFQPLYLLATSIQTVPYLFSRPFNVRNIPVAPDRTVRALVFTPPRRKNDRPSPLHVSIHAGAFMGGRPEPSAPFCELLSRDTGAVVVAITHRFAPRHPFPAAIDDVDAAIAWLLEHAEEEFGADPALLTVSGFSAGGNLALAASQAKACHPPSTTNIKASVTFYAAIEMRITPMEKPRPERFPKFDPLAFMLPVYDSYATTVRAQNMENPRLSPIIADTDTLPENMFLMVAGVDILVHEQLTFVERVKADLAAKGERVRRVEVMFVDTAFHGCFETPDSVYSWKDKRECYDRGIAFIKETHEEYGWHWD